MKIQGAEAVVRTLVNCDVSTVYGLPGTHVLGIYEALRKESRIRHLLAMHEANACIMADAQGRLTGLPGVCLLTAGPGATNAVTAMAQAYTEASPVVQITGHCGIDEEIQPLHGVDDWNFLFKIYSCITKWSVQIKRVEEIEPILSKAFDVASSGRPGPVHIEIPRDVLFSSVKQENPASIHPETHYETHEAAVKRIAELLISSNNPLIAVGKGVLREFCWQDVMKLAEALDAPIVTVRYATSAIPYGFPLYVGYDLGWTPHPLIKSLIEKADAVITFGFDLGERLTFLKEKGTLIHVHADAIAQKNEELNLSTSKNPIDVAASIKQTISLLQKMMPKKRLGKSNAKAKIRWVKRKINDDISQNIKWGRKPIHPGEISTQLSRVLNDDTIVTLDVGDSSTWMHSCYRAGIANTVLSPGRYHSMGYALPAAIAAKVSFPRREVVAVTGDGGFFMSCMDFPTAVKNKLAIRIVVMSNGHYGTIWNLQKRKLGGHTFETEIQVPDYAKYAQSFGAEGFNVDDPADLAKVLEEALSTKGPVIVGVQTDHRFPCYRPVRWKRSMAGILDIIRPYGSAFRNRVA